MKIRRLNGNALKLIACLFMLCDHVGIILLQQVVALRIIGRLAFPIFAFFIAEGCKYTNNKIRYFLQIFILGVIFFVFQYFATANILLNIFITFSCSIVLVYVLGFAKRNLFAQNKSTLKIVFSIALFCLLLFCCWMLCYYVQVDYAFWGILLPVFFSLVDFSSVEEKPYIARFDNLYCKLALGLVCLVLISLTAILSYEWVSIFSLLLLLLYNGERGSKKLKYFFYIFYPLHIAILYGILFLL